MLKTHPLFGVGFGRYTEFNELVAHNSFVHPMGEVGLFGSFFFVGMGYWFFQSIGRPHAVDSHAWGEDLWQSGPVQPARPAARAARIAAITVAGVVCTYAVVRLFGDWSA